MQHDLGYIDLEQTLDNPFGTRLPPMSQVRTVTDVFGPYKPRMAESESDFPVIRA